MISVRTLTSRLKKVYMAKVLCESAAGKAKADNDEIEVMRKILVECSRKNPAHGVIMARRWREVYNKYLREVRRPAE